MTEEEKILIKCQKLQKKSPSTYKTRSNIKKHTRKLIFKRDGYKCLKCGSKDNLTIDHIVPRMQGGVKRKFNLQTLCEGCNLEKGLKIISYKAKTKCSKCNKTMNGHYEYDWRCFETGGLVTHSVHNHRCKWIDLLIYKIKK